MSNKSKPNLSINPARSNNCKTILAEIFQMSKTYIHTGNICQIKQTNLSINPSEVII
jgi:hypothetical protein